MNKYFLSLALGIVSFSAVAAHADLGPSDPAPFDATTGTGYLYQSAVPAGDPAGFSFSYEYTATYSAVCAWSTKERTRYPYTHTSGNVVNSILDYGSGAHQIFDGYRLNGFGTHYESGDVLPIVGTICQRGKGGYWTSVDEISGFGGLYATYGTTKSLIF